MTKFLLIDLANLLFRAASVTQGSAYDKAGLAISITLKSIAAASKKFNTDNVIVCLEGKSWRKDHYALYKANRAIKRMDRTPSEINEDQILYNSINDFIGFIKDFTNCTILHNYTCEADDMIAGWIQKFSAEDPLNEFIIVSTDSDFQQLLAENVSIYNGVDKKLVTLTGMFDEKGNPWRDKKGNIPEVSTPEFILFEKCIRGDSGDNVPSAYPGVRTKGTLKKAGILEAYADRVNQGYIWSNFMQTRWADPDGVEHKVADDYVRNQLLIDLTKQPDPIKLQINDTINAAINSEKELKRDVGIQFLKFCGKNQLNELAKNPNEIVKILNKGYRNDNKQL